MKPILLKKKSVCGRSAKSVRFAGFSLVEVCLAIGLFSFCLISLLGLFHAGLQQERQSLDQTRAAHILSAVADEFQGLARSPVTNNRPERFDLELPLPGQATVERSLIVNEDGVTASATEPNAYVVHYRIEPPAAGYEGFQPHKIYLLVAWPAAATFSGTGSGLTLTKSQGKIETHLELLRE